MIQTPLMLMTPAQNVVPIPFTAPAPRLTMATRLVPGHERSWRQASGFGFAVAGNALGLLLFLTGLGVVLRLAEVLLY